MKKIIGILLIGFLSFLGCSDNDDATRTVDQAIPVAPFGNTDSMTPTYEWTPVQYATRYRLLVQDAIQDSTTQDSAETHLIDEWYTAEEAGCDSEDGLCMVEPGIVTVYENTWKVQACANDDCGLWSEPLAYEMRPTPLSTGSRFTDLGDGTVVDNNTHLRWVKQPYPHASYEYLDASKYCAAYAQADPEESWRVPTITELRSLIDTQERDPALPPGHPFNAGQDEIYWTCTTAPSDWTFPNAIWKWVVWISEGKLRKRTIISSYELVWCVQRGQ